MKFKIQNSKFKIASKREQSAIAYYAEREQLKDTEGGLKLRELREGNKGHKDNKGSRGHKDN